MAYHSPKFHNIPSYIIFYFQIYFFFGNLAMCSFAATVSTLFFESPFIGLEKIIFGRTSSLEKDQKQLAGDNKLTSSDNFNNSQASTSIESEIKFKEDSQEINTNQSNDPGRIRQNSYRQNGFDNTVYQP